MARNDNEMSFDIHLPSGWEDQTVYHFKGPEIDGRAHMLRLVVDRNLWHDNMASFVKDKRELLLETQQGIEVLKDQEVTIHNGNPVHELVYKWMIGEEKTAFCKYIFVMKDEMGFTFFTEFSKKSYKLLTGQVREIVENLLPGTYETQED
ncbi:MAG: DcrB-related protein [candidate division Zixibacteria bacterium]|nr:DcrB-related protein [candidate division Zixibacteria bacterium]